MRKINTILIFIGLISLLHNSFLIRISILISNNPNTIPYGIAFVLTVIFIFTTNYLNNDSIDKKRFYLLILFVVLLFSLLLFNYFITDEYSLKNAVVLRFPLLFVFLVLYPLKRIKINQDLFKKLCSLYLIVNMILGILQTYLNQPIVLTEFKQEPFVNTIFYQGDFSTKYSYLLNYGGKVRAFGLFDSGLTLGLFMIFVSIYSFYESKREKSIFNIHGIIFIVSTCIIYLTHTRNIILVSISVLIILLSIKYVNNNIIPSLFLIFITFGNVLALFYNNLFNENMYFIKKMNLSTLISRGSLMEEASSELNSIHRIFLGVPGGGISTIDNDMVYSIYYGGVILYLLIIISYFYILRIITSKNEELNSIDKTMLVFMLSYPFGAFINYVSHVYLMVSVCYLIIYLSSEKSEFKGDKII
ncbi:hypothetical protein [Vagococcus fluvialis]|uniref:hypothetical protein n=1 Tax=Vagococcus fluvialis TaxID=2738 RepID=UPI003B5C17D5